MRDSKFKIFIFGFICVFSVHAIGQEIETVQKIIADADRRLSQVRSIAAILRSHTKNFTDANSMQEQTARCTQLDGRDLGDLTTCLYGLHTRQFYIGPTIEQLNSVNDMRDYVRDPVLANTLSEFVTKVSAQNNNLITSIATVRRMQTQHLDADLPTRVSMLSNEVTANNFKQDQCAVAVKNYSESVESTPNLMSSARDHGDVIIFRSIHKVTGELVQLGEQLENKCPGVYLGREKSIAHQLFTMEIPADRIFRSGCLRGINRNLLSPEMKRVCERRLRNPYTEGALHFSLKGERAP